MNEISWGYDYSAVPFTKYVVATVISRLGSIGTSRPTGEFSSKNLITTWQQ